MFALEGGIPSPTLGATYMARAQNHMLMPQTGFELDIPVRPWFSLGVQAKAAFGADNVEVTTRLTNDVGLVGLQHRHSEWTYTSVYEINAFFDWTLLEKVRLRAGYTAMWLMHVAEGLSQIDYNLTTQSGIHRDDGSVFFHGPMVELQFLF
jgi:hypothetical protein